ncbi:MAG TPA: hypothetical protein PL009_03645 [Flavipsychrobacter sp.]|nr:hypothetical protein [Flavipsychrobacter sp.]
MKRLMIACSFVLFSAVPVVAQNVANADTKVAMPDYNKRLFASKINELSAYATRNSPELVKKTMLQLNSLMNESVALSKRKIDVLSGPEKAAGKKRLEVQNKLYTEIKPLSEDVSKNLSKLQEKLKAFEATL